MSDQPGNIKTEPLMWHAPRERVNFALTVPGTLLCAADGREFDVVSWAPSVGVDEIVRARMEVIVRVPKP